MPRAKKPDAAPLTTAQQLGSLIQSARKTMRRDKGLSTDIDRLPMLTWIMFLKFLDDMEHLEEERAELAGEDYRSAIRPPYRWRDWAAPSDGITGDELTAFISYEECLLPDGTRGLGLLPYLRGLQGVNGDGAKRRNVIGAVFKDVQNRMMSGYLLRDVVNKVNGIHFLAKEELFTLGHMYETMLREMRDAAGQNGEFYTPRAVVRFMVAVTDPKLGETVLDPACGTGGFLAEAYKHLGMQCQTVEDRRTLQDRSLYGGEAKPLPYLLCQMNLLLHGLEAPQVDPGNSLRFKLSELGDKDRVGVILTNPPFGGEEEPGIKGNFPSDMQTSETALLFLQLIMRRLRRPAGDGSRGGRAAVVVPNGTLYASGVGERIRGHLMREFNLHTVVRLPKGVFEPYADIPTNILFFDRSPSDGLVWFYEQPLPLDRAKLRSPCYSRSRPILFEEFAPLIEWWTDRHEGEHAWTMPVETLAQHGYNLDQKNPRARTVEGIDLSEIAERLDDNARGLAVHLQVLRSRMGVLAKIAAQLDPEEMTTGSLLEFCTIQKGSSPTMKTEAGPYAFVVTAPERRTAATYQFDEPAVCIPMVSSTGHGHASIHRIHVETGKFALANIMAAVTVRSGIPLSPRYLYYYLYLHKESKLVSLMAGTANTSLTVSKLESVSVSFPSLSVQERLVSHLDGLFDAMTVVQGSAEEIMRQVASLPLDFLSTTIGALDSANSSV